jgi:glycosyltransferase involved in cell wall biosynthesis
MNIGGPAVQVSGLMLGLNKKTFDHSLYAGFCELNEIDYLDVTRADIHLTRVSGLGRKISPIADFKALFFLMKEIRKHRPHIIHTHTTKAGLLGRVASIASLHPSIRIHTYHGHLLTGYFGRIKTTFIILTEKILGLFTDKLLAVGHRVKDDLLMAGIGTCDKFEVMPPGLSLDSLPSKSEVQNFFGLDSSRLHCAFIGRVTKIKRPDRFLDVVVEIKKRKLELSFLIAGDGDLFEYCKNRIDNEGLPVVLLGWQSNIERVLSAADIVLLTSDNEGTPLSLIQAGMAGIPVVSTNVGSVDEIVLNGKTGEITDLNVNTIADAVEKLVNNNELRKKYGVEAQKFTLDSFGIKRLVHDHENLYQRLVSNQANSSPKAPTSA